MQCKHFAYLYEQFTPELSVFFLLLRNNIKPIVVGSLSHKPLMSIHKIHIENSLSLELFLIPKTSILKRIEQVIKKGDEPLTFKSYLKS